MNRNNKRKKNAIRSARRLIYLIEIIKSSPFLKKDEKIGAERDIAYLKDLIIQIQDAYKNDEIKDIWSTYSIRQHELGGFVDDLPGLIIPYFVNKLTLDLVDLRKNRM